MNDVKSSPLPSEAHNNIHLFSGGDFMSPCHHRVLKPPGGGSHDLFGGSESEKPSTPLVRKYSTQSSINLSDDLNGLVTNGNGSENGSLKQGSCNERLFGPPLDEQQAAALPPSTNGLLENGKQQSVVDAPAPVQVNGNGRDAAAKNAAQVNVGGNYAGRKRVPPGGYSSGLW